MNITKTFAPQRHRDTEKSQAENFVIAADSGKVSGLFEVLCLSLCLCVSVVDVLSLGGI